MQRDIKRLTDDHFDLVIIGGGIFAACAAWDAALRGLSVAVIEKEDFCSGTSANSFKFIHGGIRYLQHGDIVRVRSSCRERSAMLRIAPHLVQPMPVLIPTYGYGKSGKVFLGIGMLLYDLLTLGRNRGIRDPERRIPWSKFFNKKEVLEEYPDLDKKRLTGAALFFDAQMYNPTRLVLMFIKSAISRGAQVANYVEAKSLILDGNRVVGVRAVDRRADQVIEIKGRVVLNAAGPWSEWILQSSLPSGRTEKGVYSRDACFVIRRKFDSCFAIAVLGKTSDPDALLSRPARHLFMVPWRDYTLVGVWHVVWKEDPEQITVKDKEISSFIDEINWAYSGLNLTLQDVLLWNAGLVPFGKNEEDAVNLSYGKRSTFIDHKVSDKIDGLVTLIGVRYTTARGDSAKAIDRVCLKLGLRSKRPATETIPVVGGDIEDFDLLVNKLYMEQKLGLSKACVRALAHNHGTEATRIIDIAREKISLAETIGDTNVFSS
jgi:glycerol-3-phosphate dehydrogenase